MRTTLLAIIITVLSVSRVFGQSSDVRQGLGRHVFIGNMPNLGFGKIGQQSQLQNFYQRNDYVLAWNREQDIQDILIAVRTVYLDGLDPYNYHLEYLERHAIRPIDEREAAILDVAMTDAFLLLAHDLYEGRVDPNVLFPNEWEACTTPADYAGLLLNALNGGDVCETLDLLKPIDNGYEGLKYMLCGFREIQSKGGFPDVPPGPDIKPGDMDDRMPAITENLSMLELIPGELDNGSVKYDSVMIFAVQRFQRLHGLTIDGVIGRRTQQAMALRVEDYIETIVVNLERYRWHQSQLLERSIQINIPSCELILSKNELPELQMKAIVGRPDRRTPVLSSALTLITINPTWTIPPTILKEDVLPAIKADAGYLKRHEIRVFTGNEKEIDSDSLDWSTVSAQNFRYILRQDAGPRNPLGLIKFVFPNNHTVYLHDTNTPSLFSGQDRWLSSGCIRIQSPMALVRKLLEGTAWTETMVRDEIKNGETKMILVKTPIPIHIVYFTAFVSNDEIHLLRDAYGYDKRVLRALAGPAQTLLDRVD